MYSRRKVLWASFLALLVFGIVMAVLGSVLPSVIHKFELSLVNAGSLFLLMSMGMLAGSLVFGPVVDRYGYKGLLVVCTFLIFVAIEGIALAPSISFLRLSLLLAGLAGGALNGGANALVADISEESRGAGLSFLGIFFGIGAFSVPFILGSLLGSFSYELLIALVGFMVLIPLIFLISISFPSPKHSQGFPIAEAKGLLRETTLLLFGLMLFIQSGLEMVISGWTATYLTEVQNLDHQKAVFLLSLYWLALMTGRFIVGSLVIESRKQRVLYISLFISIVGTATMVVAHSPGIAVAGLVLTGLGFAAVFPLVLAFVGDAWSRLSGTAFSLVFVMALGGGTLYPWLTGIIAEVAGLRAALMPATVSLIASVVLLGIIMRRMRVKT